MIYDEETEMYFLNDFDLKNFRGARESLRNQKPITKEEAIALSTRLLSLQPPRAPYIPHLTT